MCSGSFKNVIYEMGLQINIIYMFKQDLILNNQQGLICHKIQLNKPIISFEVPV